MPGNFAGHLLRSRLPDRNEPRGYSRVPVSAAVGHATAFTPHDSFPFCAGRGFLLLSEDTEAVSY